MPLDQREKEAVYNTAMQVVQADAPRATNADKAELAFQIATIAGQRWNSVDSNIASQIRSAPQYKNLLARLNKTGTVYADKEARALSPYAILDSGGGSGWGLKDQLISGVPNYLLYGGASLLGYLVFFGKKKGKR